MQTRRSIRVALTLLVFLIFAVYFLLNTSKFKPLLHVNALLLIFIGLGNIAAISINGLFTKFILRPFNKQIPTLESFYISLVSSVGNFFAPIGAGFGIRALYLKKKFGLPYSEYVSTLSGNYILVFLVNSFFGLMALYLLRSRNSSQYVVLVAIFTVIFTGCLLLSISRLPIPSVSTIRNRHLRRVTGIFYRILRGWSHITSHKKLMLQLIGLTFTGLTLNIVMAWMIIHSVHLSIAFAPLLLFSVLSSLSLFINITPANLGIKEAIYLFSSSVLGFSVSQIVLIALIDRGVLFFTLIIVWFFSSRYKYPEKALT